MTHLKFSSQTESEVHQTLGEEKIQEICGQYSLEERGQEILDKTLSKLKLNDLLRNKKLTSEVIAKESNGYWEKEVIEKIITAIAEAFIYAEKAFLKRRLKRNPERLSV